MAERSSSLSLTAAARRQLSDLTYCLPACLSVVDVCNQQSVVATAEPALAPSEASTEDDAAAPATTSTAGSSSGQKEQASTDKPQVSGEEEASTPAVDGTAMDTTTTTTASEASSTTTAVSSKPAPAPSRYPASVYHAVRSGQLQLSPSDEIWRRLQDRFLTDHSPLAFRYHHIHRPSRPLYHPPP